MSNPLPTLPMVEKLSSRVIRVLGGNPGKFTLQGTNTYLLGNASQRILVDIGEGKPDWSDQVAGVLKNEGANVSTALITHWHPDHVGGTSQLRLLCPSVTIYENDPSDPSIKDISPGQTFSVAGATIRAFHCPGHTTNHMAFILEEEDAMFTGDNVLGHGTAVFEDLATYMQSLDRMKKQFKGRAYPGHGAVIEDGPSKIDEYIQHRKEREEQVLRVLNDGPQSGMTPMEIVKVVYKEYNPDLYDAAARGILLILNKLEGDGKVEDVGHDKFRLISNGKP